MGARAEWDERDYDWNPSSLEAAARPRRTSTRPREGEAPEKEQQQRVHRRQPFLGCQVDGCAADLSDLRHYHQRYKVCQEHLKVPHVIHEGIVQRFCQQCSRFHAIGEFEGDKRSCRAQLQRHNARRRRKAAERSQARAAAASPAGSPGVTQGDAGGASSYRRRSTGEGGGGGGSAGVGIPASRPVRSARLAARAASRSFVTASMSSTDASEDGEGDLGTSVGTASAPSALGGARSLPEPRAGVDAAHRDIYSVRVQQASPGPALLEVSPLDCGGVPWLRGLSPGLHARPMQPFDQGVDSCMPPLLHPGPGQTMHHFHASGWQELSAAPSVQVQGPTYSSPFSSAAPGAPQGGLRVISADFLGPLGSSTGPNWQPVSLPALPMDFPDLHAGALPPHSAGSDPLPQRLGDGAVQRQESAPHQAPSGASLIAARGLRAQASRNIDFDGRDMPRSRRQQQGGRGSGTAADAPEQVQNDEVNLMLAYLGDRAAAGLAGSPRPPSAGPAAGVPMSGGLLSRRLPSPSLQGPPRPQPAPALPSPPLQRPLLQQPSFGFVPETSQPPSFGYAPATSIMRLSAKLDNATPADLPQGLANDVAEALHTSPDNAHLQGFVRPGCLHLTVDVTVHPLDAAVSRAGGAGGVAERLLSGRNGAFWAQQASQVQLCSQVAVLQGGRVVSTSDGSAAPASARPKLTLRSPAAPVLLAGVATEVTLEASLLPPGTSILCRSRGRFLPAEVSIAVEDGPSRLVSIQLAPEMLLPGLLTIELALGPTLLWPMRLLVAPSPAVVAHFERVPQDMPGFTGLLSDVALVLETGEGDAQRQLPAGRYRVAAAAACAALSAAQALGCTALAAALVAASGSAPAGPTGVAAQSSTAGKAARAAAPAPLASDATGSAAIATAACVDQNSLQGAASPAAQVRPLKCDSVFAGSSGRPPTPPSGKAARHAPGDGSTAAAAAGSRKAAPRSASLLLRDDSASALDLIAALRMSNTVAAAQLQ